MKAGTGENGKCGIFCKTRIGEGKFAKVKDRGARGLNSPRVEAAPAQACERKVFWQIRRRRHENRIAQGSSKAKYVELLELGLGSGKSVAIARDPDVQRRQKKNADE